MYRIINKRDLTDITKLFEVDAPLVARRAQAGHFVMVRVAECGERIPITIADYDREAGTVTIVVQEAGKTSAWINALEEGDEFVDFVGPLGQVAPMADSGHVVLLGGGFGVAPIHPVARDLKEKGVEVTSIIGARSEDLLIFEDEMARVSDRVLVATDDGSKGTHGFVTDVLDAMIEDGESIDEVIAIGPMPMMEATAKVTRPHGITTWVSMDPIMVDGTGMCGVCRLTVGGEMKFGCVDGPFFDGHQVDFEEAHKRVKMYESEERIAYERYQNNEKVCQRGGGCDG